jgi:hypothetical protein
MEGTGLFLREKHGQGFSDESLLVWEETIKRKVGKKKA